MKLAASESRAKGP